MSFSPETPQQKPWENKKSSEFRSWVEREALLSPDEWSSEFREYVGLKRQEHDQASEEKSDAEQQEATKERYLKLLDLTEEQIRDKKILDLGCAEGEFVRWCLENEMTQEIHGIDNTLEGEANNEKYKGHFHKGDFEEEFPVKDLDYVISVGAASLSTFEETAKNKEGMLRHAIDALGKDGEIRIDFLKAGENSEDEGIKESERVITRILKKLQDEKNISWEFRPTDIRIVGDGKDKDVILEQVLVIRRR